MARISYNATTNSQGVASATITGQGKGRLRFISKCDDLWSNEIEIDDFLLYDKGVSDNYNDATWQTFSNIDRTRESDGTKIVQTVTSTISFYQCEFYDNQIVEFDLYISNNQGNYISIRKNSTSYLQQFFGDIGFTKTEEWFTVKVTVLDGVASIYVDGVRTYTNTIPSDINRFIFRLTNGNYIKYRNFRVYSAPFSFKHYTPISLSSNSSIIQTGESATLSATLTNVLGEPMANTSVDFIEPNKTIFKDNGTTSSYDDTNWTTWSNYPPKITRKTEYTSIEQQTSGTTGFHIFNFTNLNPKSVEFDFYKTDGILSEIIFQLRNSSRTVLRQGALSSWSNTALATWYHIKFDFENKLIYCDDKSIAMNDIEPTHLYLACYQTTTEVRYKNFKVIADKTVTSTTNTNGIATTTINSDGTGERTFKASKDNIESDNTTIEDNKYYNDGTDLSTLTIPSNASVTVENGALKITTSTSGEKKIPYSFSLTSSDNYIFECEIAKLGTGQPIALYVKDSTTANGLWFAYDISTNKWNGGCITSFNNITTSTLAVGDKIRIKQENGVFTLYHNDMVIKSITRTLSGTYSIGHYTNSGRIQYIDNIKLWSI